jgi:hypothetical protein
MLELRRSRFGAGTLFALAWALLPRKLKRMAISAAAVAFLWLALIVTALVIVITRFA